jgi:hypothetical protein
MTLTDPFNDFDYFGLEDEDVKRLFDLDKILLFTRKHNVEIIRGEDWMFLCYIDGKCNGTGLTTLGAMVYGIKNYEKQ